MPLQSKDPPPINTRDKHYARFNNGSVFEFDRTTGVLKINCTRIEIVGAEESTINGKAIVVVGGMDNDTESNGPDTIVESGQF